MTDAQYKWIKEEFQDIEIEKRFNGGCRKSLRVPPYCVHLRPDGSIGGITDPCSEYDKCKGNKYKYKVDRE